MTTSEVPTLDKLLEALEGEALHTFFSALINNEDTFITGEYPQEDLGAFEHNGIDITQFMIDAVAFGILWEQDHPTGFRDEPITTYFSQPNDFSSMDEIVEAQPDPHLANFFRYYAADVDDIEDGAYPPPVNYRNTVITRPLRLSVLFGAEWEMWNADDLATELDTTVEF